MSTPREQLAGMLRRARLGAGYTSHGALAKRLTVSRPVVTRAENPAYPVPSDSLLAAWAGATGAGLDAMTELARRCRSGTPEFFMPYMSAESRAAIIRSWGGPALIPGLCQCESYARELLSVENYPAARLAELVAARVRRQEILGRAYVTAIVDYHALTREVGSPSVMAEALGHLVTLAESTAIALHVMPPRANLGTWGSLDIATAGNEATVLMGAFEDVPTTAPALVNAAMQAWERLLGAAMPRQESLHCAQEVAEQWKTRI
jgi:transcriptional regulator with XRE-family HTH domain